MSAFREYCGGWQAVSRLAAATELLAETGASVLLASSGGSVSVRAGTETPSVVLFFPDRRLTKARLQGV